MNAPVIRSSVNVLHDGLQVQKFYEGRYLNDYAEEVLLTNDELRPYLECEVNGVYVPREWWDKVKPRGEGTVVTFGVALRGGGGGGGRKILFAVAAIALMAASVYVGGPLAASATGAKLFALKAGAAALAGLGALAASQIRLGPPREENGAQKQVGSASAGNEFQPLSGLQRVVGTHRVYPKMIGTPWTDFHDDDQFVTIPYALAGLHDATDFKLADTNIEDSEDVDFEWSTDDQDVHLMELMDKTRVEEALFLTLSRWKIQEGSGPTADYGILKGTPEEAAPIFHRVVSKGDADGFKITFNMAGLQYRDPDNGDVESAQVFVRTRFRRRGTSVWTYLPDIGTENYVQKLLRLSFEFIWVDTVPAEAGNNWNESFEEESTGFSDEGQNGWKFWNFQSGPPTELSTLNAEGLGLENYLWAGPKLKIYLRTDDYPQGPYEFEIKRSAATSETVADSVDYFEPLDLGGGSFGILNPANISDDMSIQSVQSYIDEYPIEAGGNPLTVFVVKAKNRSVEKFNCIASGLIDLSAPSGVVGPPPSPEASSNPAAWFYHVLNDIHNADPTPQDRILLDEINEWYNYCIENGREVNLVAEDMSVYDLLQMIALCGRAAPAFGALTGAVVDKIRDEGPRGAITQRNASGFQAIFPLIEQPQALRVSFPDRDDDYRVREVIIYNTGYNADGSDGLIAATSYTSVTYTGLVTEIANVEQAEHELNWMTWRGNSLICTQDIEHVQWRKGARVIVEQDSLGYESGRGRIRSVEMSGLNIVALIIDEYAQLGTADENLWLPENLWDPVNLWDIGVPAGVSIVQVDGTILTLELSDVDNDLFRLELTTPIPMPTSDLGIPPEPRDLIAPGCLVVTGPYENVARDMLVWDISPAANDNAQITLIDYAEAQMYLELPPSGFVYLVDSDGFPLVDDDGAYLIEAA